jgi:hypothetical protein
VRDGAVLSSRFQTGTEETSRLVYLMEQVIRIIEEKEQKKDEPPVLSVKDTAELMKISVPTLRDHFLCRPDFPKFKAGTKYLIPYHSLMRWLDEQV